MNTQKYVFAAVILVLGLSFLFLSDKGSDKFSESNASTTNTANLTEYHSDKYKYSVLLPSNMKINDNSQDSIFAFIYDDMPSQGFYITATTTSSDIESLMYSEPGYGVSWDWVIEENTIISEFPAIITHKKYFNELNPVVNDFSSRALFVKKGGVILKFDLVGSTEEVFNTNQFIDSVKFDG
ncbi:MAG: hypothetical protein RLZZ230_740 [Candidatus Parcubacteria bacterium]|jgi:hypothetical protein